MSALHDAVSRAALAVCLAATEVTEAGYVIPRQLWEALDHLNTQVEREALNVTTGGAA